MRKLSIVVYMLLILAACGGGGGGTSTSTNSISVVYSELPETTFELTGDELVYSPACIYFTTDLSGVDRVYLWPTYGVKEPVLPLLEFSESEPDKYAVTRTIPEAGMGAARWFSPMDIQDQTVRRFAIANHGLEIPNNTGTGLSNDNFEFGDIWVATDSGSGFEFEKITLDLGFYHNIAAYDIDNNGYDDIVAVNMGMRSDNEYTYDALHAFSQDLGGTYTQFNPFSRVGLPNAAQHLELGTSGSTTFADLDNDGDKELIQSAYSYLDEIENWGAIRIWELQLDGNYKQVNTISRSGLFANSEWGASGTYTFDYNKDGLLDILVFVEHSQGVDGSGVEIYRNDGSYQFTRVTESLMPNNSFDPMYYSAREMYIVDVNKDGFDDLVFNPMFSRYDVTGEDPNWSQQEHDDWWTDGLNNGFPYKVGASIWLYNELTGFVRQMNNPEYTARIQAGKYPIFLRFKEFENGKIKFFGFSENGAPIVLNVSFN